LSTDDSIHLAKELLGARTSTECKLRSHVTEDLVVIHMVLEQRLEFVNGMIEVNARNAV
jgi:hypothetical protein